MATGHSLYFRLSDDRRIRVSDIALPKSKAVTFFQGALLDGLGLGAELRPVRVRDLWAKMVVTPFGADLKTESAVTAHWEAGKDFIIRSPMSQKGRHVCKRDVASFGGALQGNAVLVFFDNQSKICLIPLPKE